MSWTDPPSYTNGQIITQTDLHVGLRDNMRELWHEKAYVEFTAPVTLVGAAEATPTDVVSSGAVTYIAATIVVEFYTPLLQGGGSQSFLSLWDDTTNLGITCQFGITGSEGEAGPQFLRRRMTPTAATHTFKIRGYCASSNAIVHAGASGAGAFTPGYIRVWQRGA